MESPKQAVLDLLNSYTNHLASNPGQQHHKELVRSYIDNNSDKPLHELLLAINNELVQIAGKTDTELNEDITAINYFCPA